MLKVTSVIQNEKDSAP